MKECTNCGHPVDDDCEVCPECLNENFMSLENTFVVHKIIIPEESEFDNIIFKEE